MSATSERWVDGSEATGDGSSLPPRQQPFADPHVAALYDAFPFDADVPFYLDLAGGCGPRLLEVACGTGRLVLPLAHAGFRVVGVDSSPAMLALAGQKVAAAGPDVSSRVHLVEADMRSFELGEGAFDLAVVAVRSFGYLLERADQASALDTIARHLRPGGVLALDLLPASPAWLLQTPGSLRQDLHERTAGGVLVTRTEAVVSTDLALQVRVTRSSYELVEPGGRVTKHIVEWPFRWVHRFEAEHLLERAGFEIVGVYGGYEREPYTSDSKALLLVARLSS